MSNCQKITVTKIMALIMAQVFFFTGIVYSVPSGKILFRNKRPNYNALRVPLAFDTDITEAFNEKVALEIAETAGLSEEGLVALTDIMDRAGVMFMLSKHAERSENPIPGIEMKTPEKGVIIVKIFSDENVKYIKITKTTTEPVTANEFIGKPVFTVKRERSEIASHFSLRSRKNAFSFGEIAAITTERFRIGDTDHNVNGLDPTLIGQLGDPVDIVAPTNGQDVSFTIHGPPSKAKLAEHLRDRPYLLQASLMRSQSLYDGKLNQNITIILADEYDYLAGDHRKNNIIILNGSDIETIIQEETRPLFVSEFIISLFSEELAHERGAGGDLETEEGLARDGVHNTLIPVNQLEAYIAFIEKFGEEFGKENGYVTYLKKKSESYTKASKLIEARVTPVLFDGRDLLKRNYGALEDFDGRIDKLNPDEIAVIAIKIPDVKRGKELRDHFGNRAVILDFNKLRNDTEAYDYFMNIITSPDYKDSLLKEGLKLTPEILNSYKPAREYLSNL